MKKKGTKILAFSNHPYLKIPYVAIMIYGNFKTGKSIQGCCLFTPSGASDIDTKPPLYYGME